MTSGKNKFKIETKWDHQLAYETVSIYIAEVRLFANTRIIAMGIFLNSDKLDKCQVIVHVSNVSAHLSVDKDE